MNHRPTAIERAFQLAKTGHFQTVAEIRKVMSRERYSWRHLEGPTLAKQLRDTMKKARLAPKGTIPSSGVNAEPVRQYHNDK